MVSIVDAVNFLPELTRGDYLSDRDLAPFDDDDRTVSDLLVEQVEFADVLVLTKTDLVSAQQVRRLTSVLGRLNPGARLVTAVHGSVPLGEVLGTGLFDVERARYAPDWVSNPPDSPTPTRRRPRRGWPSRPAGDSGRRHLGHR